VLAGVVFGHGGTEGPLRPHTRDSQFAGTGHEFRFGGIHALMQVHQRREQLDKAFVSSVGELKSKEGWADLFGNAEIAKVIEGEAKQIFNGNLNDPKALAQKAIFAAVTPMLMQHALEQANKVAELEAALAVEAPRKG
jgi:hypothetical protein